MITHSNRQLFQYLKFYQRDLAIVMMALFCVAVSLLALGRAMRKLVDEGLKSGHIEGVNHSILLICLITLIFAVSSFFRSYFINRVTARIINRIRLEACARLLDLEIVHFETLKIGDVITRLTADIESIGALIMQFLSSFIRNSLMMLGGIILMFIQSPKLAFIVIMTIPVLVLSLSRLGHHVRNLSKNVLQLQGNIAANFEESFSNIRAIHAFNQQRNKLRYFTEQIENYLGFLNVRLKTRSLFFAVAIGFILFAIILVIRIGSADIIEGKMSSGQLISFVYYAIISGVSAGGLVEFISEAGGPLAAIERVFVFVNMSEGDESEVINGKQLKKSSISVEFREVNFAYKTAHSLLVLNNFSAQISAGSFVGIVGRSGSGKSTALQLLLKFYSPDVGLIKVDNRNIAEINTKELRKIIAYVPQEPSIFSGTIRSNILFSRPDASNEEIEQVAKLTGVTDFAKYLKLGLDSEIGEKGVRLSGGQKQRIVIARALLYQPKILLLDEATSALDSESEQALLDNIRKTLADKTIISVAHRISSIEQAQQIFVVDKGAVVAQGSHKELLKICPIYKILCEEQLISEV